MTLYGASENGRRSVAGPLSPFVLGLGAALGWIGWRAWVHRGHVVDDAFISLRHVANLLAGRGLVFNPGEVVEGATNLGWMALLAAVGAVVPVGLPALAKVLGLGLLVTAVVGATLLHRRMVGGGPADGAGRPDRVPGGHRWEPALVALLLASSPELVYFSLAGMETGLAAALLVTALWCLLPGRPERPEERPRLMAAALCCAGLATVRPEALLLFPLAAGLLLAAPGGTSRRRVLTALGLFLALVAVVTAWRLATFGTLLPNTALAKAPGEAGELLDRGRDVLLGRSVNAPAPFVGLLVLGLGGLGVAGLWRRWRAAAALLAAAAATGVLFAVYARPDWTWMGRYMAPYLPACAVLMVRGLFAGLAGGLLGGRPGRIRLGHRPAVALATGIALLFTAIGVARTRSHLRPEALAEYPGFVLTSASLADPARWIGEHLPPGAVVAARRIGALGYFGGVRVLDYAFGLTDPRVARLVARHGGPFDEPGAPELAEVWAAVRPDCVLEDEGLLASRVVRREGSHPSAGAGPGRPPAPPAAIGRRLEVHGVDYRVMRRFELGGSSGPKTATWVLACRSPTRGQAGLTRR